MSEKKLIYLSDLQLFGDNCKKKFKLNPLSAEGNGSTFFIETDNKINGVSVIYINFTGLAKYNSSVKNVDGTIIFTFNNGSFTLTNAAFTVGSAKLGSVLIAPSYKVEDGEELTATGEVVTKYKTVNNIAIEGKLDNNFVLTNIVIDYCAFKAVTEEGKTTYEVIPSKPIISIVQGDPLLNKELNVKLLGTALQQLVASTIGDIAEIGNDTAFKLKIGESSYLNYLLNTIFDQILKSTKTSKLDHNVTISYDYLTSNTSVSTNLSESTLQLPVPAFKGNGVNINTDWITVTNGLVSSVSQSPISLATTLILGGIRLGSNSDRANNPNYIFLKLIPDTGKAYIDSYDLSLLQAFDVHRGDLNDSSILASAYEGAIFLHTGETTTNYHNGYFYKKLGGNFSVAIDGANSIYNIDTACGSKLYTYNIKSGGELSNITSIEITYTGSISTPDYQTGPYSIDLQSNGESIVSYTGLTSTLLFDTYGIAIKSDDIIAAMINPLTSCTATVSKSNSLMIWRLWDVQPRESSGTAAVTWGYVDCSH